MVKDLESNPTSSTPSSSSAAGSSAESQIAAARARIEAQLAAARAGGGGASSSQASRPPQQAQQQQASRPNAAATDASANIAAARARIEAQLAAARAGQRAPTTSNTSSVPSRPNATTPSASKPNSGFDPSAIAKQVEEAKKRAMAAFGGIKGSTSSTPSSTNPIPSTSVRDSKSNTGIHPLLASRGIVPTQPPTIQPTPSGPSSSESGTGTPTNQEIKPSYSHQFDKAPKFSSVSVNNRSSALNASSKGGKDSSRQNIASTSTSIQANPYLSTALELSQDPENASMKSRSTHRGFQFHKPGRHVKEAEEQRRDARMEELKRKIEESARKAGLSEDVGSEGGGVVGMRPNPPDVEWWDLNFFPESKNYDELGDEINFTADVKGKGKEKSGFELPKGSIDNLIQHPIQLPPPKSLCPDVKPRGLMLTKQEAKKLRRQRRAAELEDKRDRIKMGELPPDPPKGECCHQGFVVAKKLTRMRSIDLLISSLMFPSPLSHTVKLANIVRVLASESVADPTKVEARVRREIAARADQHERTNLENKLTKEQKDEKRRLQKEKEEKKGTSTLVFKINHLISPSHKFKVRKNAQQNDLTGVTIFHPTFALVVVEGSFKGLKNYKHLMLNRIDWMDPGTKKNKDQDEDGNGYGRRNNNGGEEEDVNLEEIPWEENKCQLIFEGQIRERNFKGFRAHKCPTDKAAKEVLVGNIGNKSSSSTAGNGMVGYWDVAKRWDTSAGDD